MGKAVAIVGSRGIALNSSGKAPSSDLLVEMIHAVSAVVDTFELEAEVAEMLKRAGWRAAMFYHFDLQFDELPGPRDRLNKRLTSIAKAAAKLDATLDKLPDVTEPLLARRRVWDTRCSEDNDLDLDNLRRNLRQLAANAGDIIPRIPKRGVGTPGERKVGRVIRQTLPSVEQTFGEPIATSTSVDSIAGKNLRGPGGEFLRALFKIIDSHVRESTLATKVAETQALMRNPTPEYLDEIALLTD